MIDEKLIQHKFLHDFLGSFLAVQHTQIFWIFRKK
jgi:hypothetical protein